MAGNRIMNVRKNRFLLKYNFNCLCRYVDNYLKNGEMVR